MSIALLIFLAVAIVPAAAGTFTPFGPQSYVRTTGTPVTVTNSFTVVNPSTQYTLQAFNGGLQNDQTELVSSTVVTVNGVQVIGPSNFNQNVQEVDVPVMLQSSNTISVEVRGQPGGTLTIQIVGVDNDPPVITAVVSPTPNSAGWNNSNVTVSFKCTDATSGIQSCPSPQSITTEVASQTITGTATDIAGNSASTSVTVKLDKTPPVVAIASPVNGSTISLSTVAIGLRGSQTDTLSGIEKVTCNGTPAALSTGNFTCTVLLTQGANSISVQATDVAGNSNSSPLSLTYVPAPQLTITAPANLSTTNLSPTTVRGTISDPSAMITVNGIPTPQSGGSFTIPVPLVEGLNVLTAVATNASGVASTATAQVNLDTTPPRITIDSPADGSTTTSDSVTVSGLANDVVVGTVNSQDVQVTVNGITAQVANRTYAALSVPLALGNNTIQAVAHDRAGNGTTTNITINRVLATQPPQPPIGNAVITQSLAIVSGDNQAGTISAQLSAPLIVTLSDSSNHPVINQPVVFKVVGNNGTVSAGGTNSTAVAVNTDASGHAQASWALGQRAGAGNNTVQVSSPLAVGPVTFVATGSNAAAASIVVDSGNDQVGVLAQPLPFPFVADVVDSGHNRVPDVPVTFTVKQGDGTLSGSSTQTVNTDSNGRAIVLLTLGTQIGNANNVVEATFTNNPGVPVAFAASARAPGDPAATSVSGVVLDNSNNPIPGVTIRLFQTNQGNTNNLPVQVGTPVQTDAKGTFVIQPAPVGFYKLMADGTTATNSQIYPTLEYDIVTVAGNDNTVGMPIYLPALDRVNKLCVDETHGGKLTLPQVPGFSLTILPGAATFPGGSRQGCVTVTPVNGDKVPMSPGFGQQPRFIVTIQPVGTKFDPPAPMTLPNVDGLKPNAVTEMYSYDHDLGMFVAIGTGTVSADGSVIVSNPGVGVLKAGWHCGGDPNANGTVADCPTCKICQGNACVADPAQNTKACTLSGAKCGNCNNGTCQPNQVSNVKALADGKNPGAKGVNQAINFSVTFDQTGTCPSGLSFAWDFGDGSTSQQQSPSHTYTTTGVFTVTVKITCPDCAQVTGQAQVPVTVINIAKDKQLWYFNGQNPPVTGGGITITLTAQGAASGQYQWDVTAGTDKVNFENNATSITKTDVNTVVVKSLKGSAALGDVTIRLTFNGVAIPDFTTEVRTPKKLRATGTQDNGRGAGCSVAGTQGWQSFINYDILNQFDELVQNAGINEQFGAKTNTETNNWPIPTQGGFAASTGTFADNMCITTTIFTPNPLPPQSPLSARQIDKIVQKWFSGSTTPGGVGVQVQTDDFTRFIDHGRHLSITNP
jgi:hypothetical protein